MKAEVEEVLEFVASFKTEDHLNLVILLVGVVENDSFSKLAHCAHVLIFDLEGDLFAEDVDHH